MHKKDKSLAITATGSVLPAGTLEKISLDGAVELTLKIAEYSDQDGMQIAQVVYPDGFVKNHQTETVEDLLGKVSNQLRGRYGVVKFDIDKVPGALKQDEVFILKGVEYGT